MSIQKSALMFLDPYDRPARLVPALLVLIPLAALLIYLYGEQNIVKSGLLTVLAYCGVGYALGVISRNAGVRLQDKLFNKWGGSPTTQLLRHSDQHIDSHTKERYHRIISNGLGKQMPTKAVEQNDPAAADELYRAATIWLIHKTRDVKKYPLIFKENISFGFHRNALGLRPLGLIIAIICIVASLYHASVISFDGAQYFHLENLSKISTVGSLSIVVSFIMLLIWIFAIKESSLKRVAIAYAERLLEACDHLS